MMYKKITAAAAILAMSTAGALSAWAAQTSQITGYSLVTDVYGDGQKPWYIVVEYDSEIDADSVSEEDYTVEDYETAGVYVSSSAEIPEESEDGKYVIIELSTDYTTTNYGGSGASDEGDNETGRPSGDISGDLSENGANGIGNGGEMGFRNMDEAESGDEAGAGDSGFEGNAAGRGGFMTSAASNQETVTFAQTGEISSVDGEILSGSEESYTTDYTENSNLQVENFEQYVFTAEDGTDLMYSLFLPEDYSEDTAYPLVLFMPDATGEGDDVYLALTESLGV